MTFGNTSGVSMPCEVNKQIMHWYQFGLTGLSASDFDGIPNIDRLRVHPVAESAGLWGGDTFPPRCLSDSAANYFVDITTKVAEDYYDERNGGRQRIHVCKGWREYRISRFVYFGFQEPVQGLQIYLGGGYRVMQRRIILFSMEKRGFPSVLDERRHPRRFAYENVG